jgi:hypothetical protein
MASYFLFFMSLFLEKGKLASGQIGKGQGADVPMTLNDSK